MKESATGKIVTQQTRDKISIAHQTNGYNISDWEITFDDGRVIIVTNLTKWCRENGYDQGNVSKLLSPKHNRCKDIIKVIKLKTIKDLSM